MVLSLMSGETSYVAEPLCDDVPARETKHEFTTFDDVTKFFDDFDVLLVRTQSAASTPRSTMSLESTCSAAPTMFYPPEERQCHTYGSVCTCLRRGKLLDISNLMCGRGCDATRLGRLPSTPTHEVADTQHFSASHVCGDIAVSLALPGCWPKRD